MPKRFLFFYLKIRINLKKNIFLIKKWNCLKSFVKTELFKNYLQKLYINIKVYFNKIF